MALEVAWFSAALQRLDRNLAVLRQLAKLSRSDLLGDPVPLGSAERYLQVSGENAPTSPVMPPVAAFSSAVVNHRFMGNSIEICLDIAHHIIAAENWRTPGNYADAFVVLVEGGIVPQTFAATNGPFSQSACSSVLGR